MTITFNRPIGAHRDVKELQYLTALHQTGAQLRDDATVTDDDVVHYLLSRHGIKADLNFVKEQLMPGLAGALGDSPVAVFDIVEIVSILLIPHLKLESASVATPENLFGKVVTMILLDATGSTEMPILTRAVMQGILESYGEFGVAPEVIDEMLLAAGALGDPVRFNAETFMKACTTDISHYDNQWDETATTHYSDVFQGTTLDGEGISNKTTGSIKAAGINNACADDEEINVAKSKFDEGQQVKRVYAASSIDGVAENYNSKTFVTIVWFLVILIYFSYVLNLNGVVGGVDCDRFRNEFGCKIANSIAAWLLIFVQLSVLGFTFIFLTSAGNSIYQTRTIGDFLYLLVGMATVVCTTILSNIFQIDFIFVNTTRPEDSIWTLAKEFQSYIILILGSILLLFQLKAFCMFFMPQSVVTSGKLSFFASLVVPGMAKAEKATKQAASFKIDKMVTDAIALHEGIMKPTSVLDQSQKNLNTSSVTRTGFGDALLNFHATADERERYGGVLWCWKGMWNGKIVGEEGVWIHGRIYAMNAAQLFVGLLFILLYVVFNAVANSIADELEATASPTTSLYPSSSPIAFDAGAYTFSPTSSPYPTISPTTVEEGETAAAEYFASQMNSVISLYLNDDFLNGTFPEAFWQDGVNDTLAVPFAVSVLDSLPEQVLGYVVQNLDADTKARLERSIGTGGQGNATNATNASSRMLGKLYGLRELQTTIEPVFNYSTYSPTPAPSEEAGDMDDFIPKRWQLTVAVTFGGIVAVAAAFSLFVIWIPSAVSTVLQFRSGVIGSLRDPGFIYYRVAPDLTGVLFGSTFWGALFASGTLFILVSVTVFLLVYDITRPYVLSVLAQVIGIAVTVCVKIVILWSLRRVLFTGFYRRSPAFASCMMVCMECWNLALTILSMLQRLIKLILVTAFYVGRLDTPMLAPGVGNLGPVQLDDYPIQFRKDLLLHEAHRHPYIERLGVMYMLKLRYGDAFATRAGSAWRLIFVMALMPWLRRFRVDEGDDEEVQTEEQMAIDRVKAKQRLLTHKFEPKRLLNSSKALVDNNEYEDADSDNEEMARMNVNKKSKLELEVVQLKEKLASIKEYVKENANHIVDTIVWELT